MQSLAKLQHELAAAIWNTTVPVPDLPIRPNGLSTGQRLQIYHNNIFHSLTEALRACYPVIERLVEKEFFNFAASTYIKRYPSTSGDLHDYGGRFAEFLADFEAVRELPYLADVARLEWARQLAYHAADVKLLDISRLQTVPPDRYGDLRFQLHPSFQILHSIYPVLSIWETNQADYTGDVAIDLAQGGEYVLVIRREYRLEMDRLSPGEYYFLQAFAAGQDFSSACEQALATEPGFDIQKTLCQQVAKQIIVDFLLPDR